MRHVSRARAALWPLLVFLVLPVHAQKAKEMAVTFDDLPFGLPAALTVEEQRRALDRTLSALNRHGVTAYMFVNGRRLTDANRHFIDAVVRAGHGVGNHTFSHPDLHATAVDDYVADIARGDKAIAAWVRGTRYFRYPFLRQGNTVEKRDAVLAWLASRGIVVAPVSIDNDDYLYNQRLMNGEDQPADVRDQYLAHMTKMAAYYDEKGRRITGRPVKQVLLLHLNYLNSLYLDDLLQRFRDDGWSFIAFEDALTDPVYTRKYDYVGAKGAGHLDAIESAGRVE